MVAGPITMGVLDNLLKEVHEPRVRDQLQSEITTLKRVEKSTETSHDVGGRFVRFVARMQRNQGIGARREMEILPAGRSQAYATAQVNLTYQYGTVSLSNQTIELASTNAQAFANEMQEEIDGVRETLAKDMNRQVYGSNVGILGTVIASGSNSTTVLVLKTNFAMYVEEDQQVNVWDTSASGFALSGAGSPTFTVSTVVDNGDGTTSVTITPAATVTFAAGDTIRRAGNSINATTGKELTGFTDIIADSGTLFGIDPSTYGKWKASVDSNGGTERPITEGLMLSMVRRMRRKGSRASVIFSSPGVQGAYWALLSQLREFVNTETFTGGYEGLAFAAAGGKIPLIDDVDAPPNRMYFVDESHLKFYEAGDWSFQNKTGSNWKQITAAQNGEVGFLDGYTSHLYKYCQLATDRRNAHGLLSDLTEAED